MMDPTQRRTKMMIEDLIATMHANRATITDHREVIRMKPFETCAIAE